MTSSIILNRSSVRLPTLEEIRAERSRRALELELIRIAQHADAIRAECESSLLAFTRQHWAILEPKTPFVEGWALDAICEHLEAVTAGDITRLLMNVPPGFMKSLMTNVFWPAWEWVTGHAHNRFVTFSYAASLTERDNRRFLDLIKSPQFQELWKDRFTLRKAGETLISNDKTGWKLASSVGGVGTGERGDRVLCLPYDERVLTNRGWMPIGEVVEGRLSVEIAGKSPADSVEWQLIEAYEKNPGRALVEIVCDTTTLRCTADHRVFVEGRGYVAASSIGIGETIWTYGVGSLPELRHDDLRQAESYCVPEILLAGLSLSSRAPDFSGSEQQAVPGLRKAGLSTTGTFGAHSGWAVLLPQVLRKIQRWGKQSGLSRWTGAAALRALRQGVRNKSESSEQGSNVLQKMRNALGLGAGAVSGWIDPRSVLRKLRHDLSTPYQCGLQGEMLFEGLLSGNARAPYEGCRQWPVRSRSSGTSLSRWLDANLQGDHSGAGRKRLQAMPGAEHSRRSIAPRASYRLRERESGREQPDHTLQGLPRSDARSAGSASTLERAIVRAVTPAGYAAATYNLRVGPHHNYFAEGILVHNCDDPHNVKESESDDVRQETVRWFRESMSNRLNDMERSAIVVIMQRVHEEDVSGAIIESSADYTHLMIPMEFDGRRYTTSIGWTDPREYDGELAWPERFSAKVVADIKDISGPYAYSGQYQQAPSPRGGGIFQRDWWQTWDEETAAKVGAMVPKIDKSTGEPVRDVYGKIVKTIGFPACEFILASMDSAYTEKEENDYSALTIWGVFRNELDMPAIMLMEAWQDRLAIHDLVERSAASCKRFKVDRLLIEAKASGISVAQELRRLYAREKWSVQLIDPKGDKVARAYAVQPMFSGEMIWAPRRAWSEMLITQMAQFPKGGHDDLVDSATQALKFLRNSGIVQFDVEIAQQVNEAMQHKSGNEKPLYPV